MAVRKKSAGFERAWRELRNAGVLVGADAALPSVASLVAEAPIHGSWWAHPQAHEIFRVGRELETLPAVLSVRLISGKITLLHRKLWPALWAVATAREPWQMSGLPPRARWLLACVERAGLVRTDHLAKASGESAGALGEAARELEKRLLVYGESLHSESGAHTKRLESWEHLAARMPGKIAAPPRRGTPASAKKQFEEIAGALEARYGVPVKLPWQNRRAQMRSGRASKPNPSTYSLWLMPSGRVYHRLRGVIVKLSRKYSTPLFKPHVTLLGRIAGPRREVLAKTAQLARGMRPLVVRLGSLDCFDEYYRCLFVRAVKTGPLKNAYRAARKIFGIQKRPPFMPHLSLMYGEFPARRKEPIIRNLGGRLCLKFEVRSVQVYSTRGKPRDWRRVRTFRLNCSALKYLGPVKTGRLHWMPSSRLQLRQ